MPTSRSYPRHLVEFQQETRIYWGFFVLFFWAKMKKASIVFKLSFILFITRFTLVAYLSWKPYFFLYPTYPYGALLSILVVCSRNLMLTGAPFLGGFSGGSSPLKIWSKNAKIVGNMGAQNYCIYRRASFNTEKWEQRKVHPRNFIVLNVQLHVAMFKAILVPVSSEKSRQSLKTRLVDKNFEANYQDEEKNKQSYCTG